MEVFSQSRLLLPRWVSLLSSWQNLIRTVCVLWMWAILYMFWATFCIGHSTCLKRQPVSSDNGALDRCGSLRDMLPAVLVYKRDETQGRHNEIPQKIVHHSRTKCSNSTSFVQRLWRAEDTLRPVYMREYERPTLWSSDSHGVIAELRVLVVPLPKLGISKLYLRSVWRARVSIIPDQQCGLFEKKPTP